MDKKVGNPLKQKQTRAVGLEHILRKIHFQDLEVFDVVARLGSISGAARELKLQAPHVSKSIKRIEDASRLLLFQRSKAGVTLTPEGRKLLTFIQKFLKFISTESSFTHPTGSVLEKKAFTLSGPSYLIHYLIAPAISNIKLNENRYRFRLIEQGESQLVGTSLKRLFEIAVHSSAIDWPKSWITVPIGNFSWGLFGRVGHPLGSTANEIDVKTYPFVMPVSLVSGEFRAGEDKCPLPVSRRIAGDEVQTAEMGLHLLNNSDQLVFVPEIIARAYIQRGLIQEIKVRQWHPVRETLSLSVQSDNVPQRLFEQLVRECEEVSL